jgi:dimethyl sulfoxide reductase membrane subunit
MATVNNMPVLPYGVGRISRRWLGIAVLLLVIFALGVFAFSRQILHGEEVTGLMDVGTRGGAPWGLYVVFVIYFVGASTGVMGIAIVAELLKIGHMRSITRVAEGVAIISLVLGALCVLADLGQPLRGILNFFRYAHPMSPFFGTFTMVVSGTLFASLVYLYLALRPDAAILATRRSRLKTFYRWWASGYKDTPAARLRRERSSIWLALGILPLRILAYSTLGFVFGLQVGRPGWQSALQAPGFMILAVVSGAALLILVAATARHIAGAREKLTIPMFAWLSNLMTILLMIYLYFLLAELLTAGYNPTEAAWRVTSSLLIGSYAVLSWFSIGMLLLATAMGTLQMARRRYSLRLMVIMGLLVTVSAILQRYLIVVPSLTTGALLPYKEGTYNPTLIEYGVVLGIAALGALMFMAFLKVVPIMAIQKESE